MEHTIFFDTETNGLPRNAGLEFPSIMQIVIFNSKGDEILSQYIYPGDGVIDASHIHGIDKKKLDENNALKLVDACELIKSKLYNKFGRCSRINWVAYNNFGFDQAVLEANFGMAGIRMPVNWYFVDIYPLVKDLYPDMKPNYKLKTVYQNLMNVSNAELDNMEFHNAEVDVLCLYAIYNKIGKIFGPSVLGKYTRPQLNNYSILDYNISVLNGYNPKFISSLCVKDLMLIYKNCGYDINAFEQEIRKTNAIFYVKMISSNINTIKHSLNLK